MVFRLIIDTGTWLKLDKLLNLNLINEEFLNLLYNWAEIVITPEIEQELNYYTPNSWKKEKTYIVPITKKDEYMHAINDGFDVADSSIFGIKDLNEYYIITEDRPLMKYGKIYGLNILFLIEFFSMLVESDIISKKELYSLNKSLFQLRNIDKKMHRKIKVLIQKI